MNVKEIKAEDLNGTSNHNKTEKKRFSFCKLNPLPTLLVLLFILLFPLSLFSLRSDISFLAL